MTKPETHPPTFGRWLRQLRSQSALTQEALAELAFCSVQTIRFFENGKRRPSQAMAEQLATVLGLPAEQKGAFIQLARTTEVTRFEKSAPPPEPSPAEPIAPPPLPLITTPFIGRAAELTSLRHLLVDEEVRLLTIVGPGGIGKTRLALDLTTQLAPHFADGVGFVTLAAIDQVQHLSSAIAASLHLELHGATDQQQQVNAWLAGRHLLLTLDNFEQLLTHAEIVDWVRQLLATAPRLQLLITSRERLRVKGERIFELGGLALPDPHQPLETGDAALLFLERAQQIAADFVINAQNHAAICRICQLVEGMPLGIELAAAWVHVLTPTEIAEEISRSIDFLARSDRDMTPRHRSMRAVFAHSWQLLSEEERSALMKLSVFRGGCTREAAQQVAGATLPILANLIDKSLLRKSQTMPTRYTMHELVRQYAADRLAADPPAVAALVDAHAAYYHQLVKDAEQLIWGANIGEAVNRLEADNDNVRAALTHYLAHPTGGERGLQMAGLLWRFWEIRGYITEGRNWLEQVLQRRIEPTPAWRWLALHGAGNLANDQGDYAVARQHYQECLQLLQTRLQILTNPEEIQRTRYRIANTLNNLGYNALLRGELGAALADSEAALTLHRQINIKVGQGLTLTNLARIKLLQQQYVAATQVAQECLALYQELGDERGIGWNLQTLGTIAREQGDYSQAAKLYEEWRLLLEKLANQADLPALYLELGELARVQTADQEAETHYQAGLALAQRLGNKKEMASLLDRLSLVASRRRDYAKAITLSEQSIALQREIGNGLGLSEALHHRGLLAHAQAAYATAALYYTESLQLSGQLTNHRGIITVLLAFAALAMAAEPDPARAAHLLAAAAKVRSTLGINPTPEQHTAAEAVAQAVRARLGEAAFATAWAAGQAMTVEQAIHYALAGE